MAVLEVFLLAVLLGVCETLVARVLLALACALLWFIADEASKRRYHMSSVEEHAKNASYVVRHPKAPRMKGPALRAFAYVLRFSSLARFFLRRSNKLDVLDGFDVPNPPTLVPRHFPEGIVDERAELAHSARLLSALEGAASASAVRFRTIRDYAHAYRSGVHSPEEVAETLIAAIESTNAMGLNCVVEYNADWIRKQAKSSAERWASGRPLSLLDGVPVSVKDQMNAFPYLTGKGSSRTFATHCEEEDATVVSKLRSAGALLYGKVNMTEIGIHVSGNNAHARYGHCKNPFNVARHTGGSSSGSGCAVAAGLGPVSVGADGGGSIRIPAALCGVFGLKPTCGRVSLHRDWSCAGSVVDVVGPLAASADDAAITMAIISSRDVNDEITLHAPPLDLSRMSSAAAGDISGVRIGVYREWAEDCDNVVKEAFWAALDKLKQRGAVLEEVSIADLDLLGPSHAVTITSEMYSDIQLDADYEPHVITAATESVLQLFRDNTAAQYLKSARMKTRFIAAFKQLLQKVDVLALPMSACVAPLRPTDVNEGEDEADIEKVGSIMRYPQAANFTGLPACTVPVGLAAAEDNMPVSVQFIGRAWEEDLLLSIARACEEGAETRVPDVYFDMLPKLK
eukprot:TRINITY_DN3351_c0_g1_i1.p1 TRINITY_DN3351_c0_g1~~TRINITY_DN3351_c0_g1_i1.p1  ORF type:complete len:646 (+),score=208.30 TRINITY_DN3351_c0_g1_i1:58-1938(+)